MRVVHVSTSDIGGGAAKAAYRLHTGLLRIGQDSQMFVLERVSDNSRVQALHPPMDLKSRVWRRLVKFQISRDYARYDNTRPSGFERFNLDRSEYGGSLSSQLPHCDIINLHFVGRFLDYQTFFTRLPTHLPIVWTAHDMAPFTGGCPYSFGCQRFMEQCGTCPQLGSQNPNDLSREAWKRKRASIERVSSRFHAVVVSEWMLGQARCSALWKGCNVTKIPYGLDTEQFKPYDQTACRTVLAIPQDAHVILFSAVSISNRRKGFDLLIEALKQMDNDSSIFLISVGDGKPLIPDNIRHLHLGYIDHPLLLSLVYNAADLFVIPSLEEAFGQTALESLACGTPIVGFDVGGIPDIVRPGITGLLALPGDVTALRNAMVDLLQAPEKRAEMALNCRRIAVEEYSIEGQAQRYLKLYQESLSSMRAD